MANLHLMNEVTCPVPADMLSQVYRAGADAADMVENLSETQRIELAVFCYSRAHLRAAAMSIAARCNADRLIRVAGNAGCALAAQCQQPEGLAPTTRVSLAGTRTRH